LYVFLEVPRKGEGIATQKPLSKGAIERVGALLGRTRTKADFRRVQCVWLRAKLGLSNDEIAVALGWSPNTVRAWHSPFLRHGEGILVGVGRGGRQHAYLAPDEEEAFLEGFLEQAERGGILVVGEIKAAYEEAVGHPVPKSTVYRMLARHGWRKVAPRPRHPKGDPTAQEAFKNNSLGSSRTK
jgi:transposase